MANLSIVSRTYEKTEKIKKIFKKTIDKQKLICYNIICCKGIATCDHN